MEGMPIIYLVTKNYHDRGERDKIYMKIFVLNPWHIGTVLAFYQKMNSKIKDTSWTGPEGQWPWIA